MYMVEVISTAPVVRRHATLAKQASRNANQKAQANLQDPKRAGALVDPTVHENSGGTRSPQHSLNSPVNRGAEGPRGYSRL